jgi:glycosyltransferase involved in cell wall biosynthesis
MFPEPPEQIVGAAGRISPEKGFDVLVEAAAIMAPTHPRVGFIHFGNGPLKEQLEKRIRELGLTTRFLAVGFRSDLDRFIPAWDLAVIPSYTEGLPNIALEAFAASVPVVGTAVGGIPEVIDDGQNGYLVPPGDPQALARSMSAALSSENWRRQMGQRGRNRVVDQFTFAGQMIQYERLFEDLTGQNLLTV